MDGFFAAYLTGRGGVTVVLFVVKANRLVGVDMGGLKYDGELVPKQDGTGFSCRINYTLPSGISVITGVGPVAASMEVKLTAELPTNFAEGPVVRIETPTGPVNAKFTKLRDLDL
jgi:hypothetical protein